MVTSRKNRFRFGLKSILLLMTCLAIVMAWVAFHRSRNSNQLVQALEAVGNAEVEFATELPGNEDRFSKMMANTAPKPTQIRLHRVRDSLAQTLATSFATDKISQLDLVQYAENHWCFDGFSSNFDNADPSMEFKRLPEGVPFASDNSPTFFRDWPSLKRIVIRDVVLPKNWIEDIGSLKTVEEVIVSGGHCNIEPESFVGMKSLKVVTLCNRGITTNRLNSLKRAMPQVRFRIQGSFDSPYVFGPDDSLSEHDPQAFQKMKKLLHGIDKELERLNSKVRLIGKPATQQKIAEMERELGMPLPRSLRAFYEVTNGWEEINFFLYHAGIHSIEDAVSEFKERASFIFEPDKYEFSYGRYFYYSDPTVIPLNFYSGIWSDRDLICRLDPGGESGPSGYNQDYDLFRYFEEVLRQLKSQDHLDFWIDLDEEQVKDDD